MKFRTFSHVATALTVLMSLGMISPVKLMAQNAPPTPEEINQMMSTVTIWGLTANNQLVRFGSLGRPLPVTGLDGNLVSIDFRPTAQDPARRLLYGLTDTNKLYTIDPSTGKATLFSALSTGFNDGFQSGADFNPQVDRLRLVGSSGRNNFSVNVDPDGNGIAAVTVQTVPLAYAAGDRNNGKAPNVTGAAYTNNTPGTTSTVLYDLDYDLDVLVTQTPPANGQLQTVGSLGFNLAPTAGFDIATDAQGRNFAFAVSGLTLYNIDLTSGRATSLGSFLRTTGGFIGLAVIPNPTGS
jgi:hypothetical protein